jgi:hypothetical protein
MRIHDVVSASLKERIMSNDSGEQQQDTIDDRFPSDAMFRKLKIAFYRSEAALLAGSAIVAGGGTGMLQSVWNHQVLPAMAYAAVGLLGLKCALDGKAQIETHIPAFGEIAKDMGHEIAHRSGMTDDHLDFAFAVKGRPTEHLMDWLAWKAGGCLSYLTAFAGLTGYNIEDMATNGVNPASIIRTAVGVGTTFFIHRSLPGQTHQLAETGLNAGLIEGVDCGKKANNPLGGMLPPGRTGRSKPVRLSCNSILAICATSPAGCVPASIRRASPPIPFTISGCQRRISTRAAGPATGWCWGRARPSACASMVSTITNPMTAMACAGPMARLASISR